MNAIPRRWSWLVALARFLTGQKLELHDKQAACVVSGTGKARRSILRSFRKFLGACIQLDAGDEQLSWHQGAGSLSIFPIERTVFDPYFESVLQCFVCRPWPCVP